MSFFQKKFNHLKRNGFLKNPFFYFGILSFVLCGLLFLSSSGLAQLAYSVNGKSVFFNSFFKNSTNSENGDLFFGRNGVLTMETPDLKIIQDNFVYGITTPRVLTTQTLGTIFGGPLSENKEVTNYYVQPGDTVLSIAQTFNISVDTLLWANDLNKNSTLKVGQTLVILPVSGLAHVVKSGDTISEISKKYKSKTEDIVAFNNLTSEGDIFIGDILILPGGIMPSKPLPNVTETALADNFFIYPAEGQITQGLHWYNAVDVGNKCGTPVYAAASGVVQRARYGWNAGGGNQVTILHPNGVVTYYGHLGVISVNQGEKVEVGTRIGLIGNNGISTGCHLHFGVTGAKNPLAKFYLGTFIRYR